MFECAFSSQTLNDLPVLLTVESSMQLTPAYIINMAAALAPKKISDRNDFYLYAAAFGRLLQPFARNSLTLPQIFLRASLIKEMDDRLVQYQGELPLDLVQSAKECALGLQDASESESFSLRWELGDLFHVAEQVVRVSDYSREALQQFGTVSMIALENQCFV